MEPIRGRCITFSAGRKSMVNLGDEFVSDILWLSKSRQLACCQIELMLVLRKQELWFLEQVKDLGWCYVRDMHSKLCCIIGVHMAFKEMNSVMGLKQSICHGKSVGADAVLPLFDLIK